MQSLALSYLEVTRLPEDVDLLIQVCLIGFGAKLQESGPLGTGLDTPEQTTLPMLQLLQVLLALMVCKLSLMVWVHAGYMGIRTSVTLM